MFLLEDFALILSQTCLAISSATWRRHGSHAKCRSKTRVKDIALSCDNVLSEGGAKNRMKQDIGDVSNSHIFTHEAVKSNCLNNFCNLYILTIYVDFKQALFDDIKSIINRLNYTYKVCSNISCLLKEILNEIIMTAILSSSTFCN